MFSFPCKSAVVSYIVKLKFHWFNLHQLSQPFEFLQWLILFSFLNYTTATLGIAFFGLQRVAHLLNVRNSGPVFPSLTATTYSVLLVLAPFEGKLRPELCFDSIHVVLQVTVRKGTPNHMSPACFCWQSETDSSFICNISYTFGL